MQVARTVALRSLCERDQVGAVIVTRGNRIVSTGYNGPPSGFSHNDRPCREWCGRACKVGGPPWLELAPDYSDCPSLHAEANALSVCDRSVREGGTIYVTSGVCFGCAKLIANSGLATVVIDMRLDMQTLTAHRNVDKSYTFLESVGITVVTG